MAESELHKELKYRATCYLLNKGYWICGAEVPMPVGICDAWGMQHWGKDSMAIEVKISVADFRSRSQRYKEASQFILGNKQYVLCQAGLIQPEQLHNQWGLLWWQNGRMVNKKKAPHLEMTAEQKLDVIQYFLNNGMNPKRPLLTGINDNVIEISQIQQQATHTMNTKVNKIL